VDYTQTLHQMIRTGYYDWVNSDISASHFAVQGQGKIELNIEFLNYGKVMESDDIARDLKSRGLRPATLPELLAFGATYPEKQREFPIVALGFVWRGSGDGRCVPSLVGDEFRRALRLDLWNDPWYSICRFAAVRK
jgi:hypothetical protein